MRIKLDENLPLQVAPQLAALGHDVHTTPEEGLAGCKDSDLFRAAQQEKRLLLTQDLDFSDARTFVPGSHEGIVLIRLRSPSRKRRLERVMEAFRTESTDDWHGAFVIITEQKVRVRNERRP
jgi:predicted nuclease of predicted toxin-antitoxin system